MDIGTDTMVGLHDGLVGIADTLVNLVAIALLIFELESDLLGGLFCSHGCMDGQQTETWEAGNGALYAIGVANGLAKHLIAAADAHNSMAVAMGTYDGLSTAVSSQFKQVV